MAQASAITPHISSLPAELLQQIFLETPSPHALLLVRRRISALYAPYRFRDVAVSGKKQLTALLSALDAADPSEVRVERLFMSDHACKETRDDYSRFDYSRTWIFFAESGWVFTPGPHITRLFAGVLRHAAPHARAICVLAFDQEHNRSLQCFSGLSFPALRRLALRYQHHISDLSGDWEMPALQTLVLSELKGLDATSRTRAVVDIFRMCAAQLAAVSMVDFVVSARPLSGQGVIAFAFPDCPPLSFKGDPSYKVWGYALVRLRVKIRRDTGAQTGLPETDGTLEDASGSLDGWIWEVVSDNAEGSLSYDQWRAEHEAE